MTQLSDSVIQLFTKNNTHTGREIIGQPTLWQEIHKEVLEQEKELQKFLDTIRERDKTNIVLTGAGSSAFIGEVAQFAFRNAGFKNRSAIPTTDLVTHFTDLIDRSTPLLLISFGRSGNSPESVATYDLAEKHCDNVHHLIITCNKEGALARKHSNANTYVLTLPPEAEDQGLAMTGSFSGMLLAATLIAHIPFTDNNEKISISDIAEGTQELLNNYSALLREIAEMDFNRIIFLGDGPLTGCARESHLKVQELTDGLCIGKYDSFLGFRHGPKAVVDDRSLVVYLLSNRESVARYEFDLIKQISSQGLGLHTLAAGGSDEIKKFTNTSIDIRKLTGLSDEYLAIPFVLIAQIIGYFKSQSLGLNPDQPSRNGAIARVVEGVRIYD